MSLNFLMRMPSVFQNVTIDTMRKRQGLTFRKTLGVYNFKVKRVQYYKNTHAIDLKKKEQLRASGSEKSALKIKAYERISNKPYGKFTNKGIFKRDTRRIPNFNIPNLIDFPLKPYVSFNTDLITDEFKVIPLKMNRELLMNIGKEQLSVSKDPKVQRLYNEIFNTEEGQKIVEEFLEKQNRKSKLRIVNF